MNTAFTFASLAAGAGVGSFGFSRSGATCLATVEINENRRKCLQHHYPDANHLVDLRQVSGKEIGQIDVLFVSTPCPSFSAGNRNAAGLDDDRGNLLFEAFRLADEVRPKAIVMENVPALLFENHSKDVSDCLVLPETMGYRLVLRENLDARRFGVPQSRRRLFFVWLRSDIQPSGYPLCIPSAYEKIEELHESWLGSIVQDDSLLRLRDRIDRHGKPGFEDLSSAFIGECEEPDEWKDKPIFHCNHSNSAFGIGYMLTLTKTGRPMVRWQGNVHHLSVTAWEELMGLPSGFTSPIGSNHQRKQACGDGIAVPVAEAVGKWVGHILGGER